jgi:sodium-dependent dicarboxylate transporter 2/3/5
MLQRIEGVEIDFLRWMLLGIPAVVLLFGFLIVYLRTTLVDSGGEAPGGLDQVRQELARLGPLTPGERNVMIAFGVTVALWIAPGFVAAAGLDATPAGREIVAALPEAVAALIGAILLFVLPVNWRARRFTLTWNEAVRIDWGIILLFGGGLALGDLTFSTGLAGAVGEGIADWLPFQTAPVLTIIFTALAILMSETASNTASATMIVPVAIAVAEAAGVRPIEPALGATLGASMGFMMPISTPPNAIVYSSGYVPITAMMRYGLMLDAAAFVLIVALVLVLGPILF